MPLNEYFHATVDKQVVRDEFFGLLAKHEFRIDATILEKSKAQPQTRLTEERFYQYAWHYHLKHVGPNLMRGKTELLITAAAIGTKRKQASFTSAVNDVVQQAMQRQQWATTFPRAEGEPCLQVADYCAWAIQRKWERGDSQSYALIQSKIASEYDLWSRGGTHYY